MPIGVPRSAVAVRTEGFEGVASREVKPDPTMVQAWVNLGGVRLMRWEFKGCLEANLQAAKLRGDLPIVHYNMGQAHLYLNQPEDLVRCNERVIELDSENGAAYYHAAVGHLAMDNMGAAERYLGRAIELGHPPNHEFVKAMEKAHIKKQRMENVSLIEISGAKTPDKTKED